MEEVEKMAPLDLSKRFKHWNPLEPSMGVVGFLFVASLFVGSFFCLDYRAVTQRLKDTGLGALGSSFSSLVSRNERPGFLDEVGNGCDVFDGNWVWDEEYPLYESKDCSPLDGGFRCSENGRPDSFYTKWRWQPKNCNLPRFSKVFQFAFRPLVNSIYERFSDSFSDSCQLFSLSKLGELISYSNS